MSIRRTCCLVLLAAACAALPAPATAAPPAPVAAPAARATGRITGTARDANGGAVPYARVVLPGTRQQAFADEDGRFVLPAVPVGDHLVRIEAMGFPPLTQVARVDAGAEVRLAVVFGEQKVVRTMEVLEIHDERRVSTRTEQRRELSGEQIRERPVDSVVEAVALEAGVVATNGELHVRGGRGDEFKMNISGAGATDPGFGGSAGIATVAVASADFISGGFDAEHGGALSGILSVTTREGDTKRFGGDVRWDTDRYGDPTKTFDGYDRLSLGFGGPTAIRGLTWFAAYEGTFQDTYLKSSLTKPSRTVLDFVRLGGRQDNRVNTNVKLAWRVNPADKLTFETIRNRTVTTPYLHDWSRRGWVREIQDTTRAPGQPDRLVPRYGAWSSTRVDSTYQPMNMPDHVPTTEDRYRQWTAAWTSQRTDREVWTTRLSSVAFERRSSVGGKAPWEYDTQSPFYWSGNTEPGTEQNPYFATHGDFPVYTRRRTDVYGLKSDYTSRRWPRQTWKSGVELNYNRIENLSLTSPNAESNGLPGGTRSAFVSYNPEGAAFLLNRWEFEGLVLNAGVRFDLFSPGLQVDDADLPSGHRYKQQVSPSLGVAYPVSDRDVFSLHYGRTFQTPNRSYVFENRGIGSTVVTHGNPDLDAETNIAYQASLQHLFSKDVAGTFSVFFRDIFGLITARRERDDAGNLVAVWTNGDYASARGFEASLSKSFSHRFSADAGYSYSIATGVASDPSSALQFINGGRLYLPISEQALAWDQRHTLSLNATMRDAGKWGFRLLWTYGSGLPFTPVFRNDRRPDPVHENSRRLPSTSRLTVDADKFYRVWGQEVTLFVDARNLLGARNVATLSPATGPNPLTNSASLDDYVNYYTETGRVGGAYLKDLNGDGTPEWVPLEDPRVLEEGRVVRAGISMRF